jgi:NUMOD4 motif/HNH endonuclease
MEIWRDIPGYIGLYQASSEGRIRSLDRTVSELYILSGLRIPKKVLSPSTDNHGGRQTVVLCRGGEMKRFQVHRLVLFAFKGLAPVGTECRHLDGNHLNNRPGNLEWATHTANMEDKEVHGTQTQGEDHPRAKLTDKQVREIRAASATHRELAQRYGVSQVAIHLIRARKTWKHVA